MSDTNSEAAGLQARIAVLDRDIEHSTAEMKSEHRAHWLAYHETNLYDALRRRDVLQERLKSVTNTKKVTK